MRSLVHSNEVIWLENWIEQKIDSHVTYETTSSYGSRKLYRLSYGAFIAEFFVTNRPIYYTEKDSMKFGI